MEGETRLPVHTSPIRELARWRALNRDFCGITRDSKAHSDGMSVPLRTARPDSASGTCRSCGEVTFLLAKWYESCAVLRGFGEEVDSSVDGKAPGSFPEDFPVQFHRPGAVFQCGNPLYSPVSGNARVSYGNGVFVNCDSAALKNTFPTAVVPGSVRIDPDEGTPVSSPFSCKYYSVRRQRSRASQEPRPIDLTRYRIETAMPRNGTNSHGHEEDQCSAYPECLPDFQGFYPSVRQPPFPVSLEV
jgi:hypothetical protein